MFRVFLLNIFFYVPIWVLRLVYFKRRDPLRGHLFDFQSSVILDVIPKKDLSIISDNAIQETRDLINEKRSQYRLSLKPKEDVAKKDHNICIENKLLLREYIPNKLESNKAILYFHGGGYVLSSIETHDLMVSFLSDQLKTKTFSLEYRLSPENKHPKALHDALEAYEWIIEQGYNANDISFCGDSAGAHLAASLVHHLIMNNMSIPNSQMLIYPMCDPSCSSESHSVLYEGYLLTKKNMVWFWDKFGNNESKIDDPTFNLLKFDSKKRVPITIIVTAGFDPLCDEAEEYAFLLHQNDNNVKQLHYPSMFHGFASMTRLKAARLATEDFLREYKKIL
jgi:acetyl esterase|tara:strand:+ start:1243 stop:2253 length:1011 start_codon:yes stop_codon:yes gene_type:complete